MFEAALLSHDRVPGYPLLRRLDDIPVKIRDADRVLGKNGNFPVTKEENVARVLQNGRDVGRDELPVDQLVASYLRKRGLVR